ncbi:bromodomain adjacent to zinc finger domain protein 1A-like isoform X2 [Paramacrobiotus metropolitanus]|nr:bromodomain adjacent to zinc finger domain protein 1A-like isoform X2 [Paramacrobiotus metropolitanus]
MVKQCILQYCKCKEPTKSDSIWSLKYKTIDYFDLNALSWWDMFTGPEPHFSVPPKPRKHFPRQDKQDKAFWERVKSKKEEKKKSCAVELHRKGGEPGHSGEGKRKHDDDEKNIGNHYSHSKKSKASTSKHDGLMAGRSSSADKAATQEQRKLKQQEYKKRWREKMKMDKERLSNVWAQVFSVGEDLECSGLKPIPVTALRLDTLLPDEFVGDGLFVLEFFRIFGPVFDKSNQLINSSVWDLDRLHVALSSTLVDGDFATLLTFCAKALIVCAPAVPNNATEAQIPVYSNGWQNSGMKILRLTDSRIGTHFYNLPVTASTVSEIIRMCLLVATIPVTVSHGDLKYDGVILRHLKTPAGVEMYRIILSKSVFALSFAQRLELLVLIIQSVMESGNVREKVEKASSSVEEAETSLKGMKKMADDVSRITKAKIAAAAKERNPDTAAEKNDRFRQILEFYTRKRSARSEKERTREEILEDLKVLDEGRRKRKLATESDFIALSEAFMDLKAKFDAKVQDEKNNVHKKVFEAGQNFRIEPVGMDRHFFKYWLLPTMQGLLLECSPDKNISICSADCICETILKAGATGTATSWWIIRDDKDIASLPKHLLINGEREVALKRALDTKIPIWLHGPKVATLPAHHEQCERVTPVIVPSDSWDNQLHRKIQVVLKELNTNLLNNRFGGISDPAAHTEWANKLIQPVVHPAKDFHYESKQVPSPEIREPPSDEQRTNSENSGEKSQPIPGSAAGSNLLVKESLVSSPNVMDTVKPEEDHLDSDSESEAEDDKESKSEQSHQTQSSGNNGARESDVPVVSPDSNSVGHIGECVLELIETIGIRFLGAPLVTISEDYVKDSSQLDRWKASLRTCTTLSQISLHLHIAEHSVVWQKSTVNGSCKACRKRGDSTNLVYCDRCGKIYHLNCVIPPLQFVPDDEWACPLCLPPTAVARTNRRARNAHVNYNEDTVTNGFRETTDTSAVKTESHTTVKPAKHTTRAERASHRNKTAVEKVDYPVAEKTDPAAFVDDMLLDDGLRRSGRTRRVNYRELADGCKKEETVEEENDSEPEQEDEPYSAENHRSHSSSEESEFDPETKPRWGKKHKRPKQ